MIAHRIATAVALVTVLLLFIACGEFGSSDPNTTEFDATGHVKPVDANAIRATLLSDEKNGNRRVFRWTFEIGTNVRSYQFGVLNALGGGNVSTGATVGDSQNVGVEYEVDGGTVSTPATLAGRDPRKIDVVYEERKVTGDQILNIVKNFGGDETKDAVLKASPDFSRVFAHQVRLRVGGTTYQEVVPGSVVKETYNTSPHAHLGPKVGASVVLLPGRDHVLFQRMYLNMDRSTFTGQMAGEYTVLIDGKKVEFKDLKTPGWLAWFRFQVE